MGGVFPPGVFPPEVFPPPVFPGDGGAGDEVPTGQYRHVAPTPIQPKATGDLYTLARGFEALED